MTRAVQRHDLQRARTIECTVDILTTLRPCAMKIGLARKNWIVSLVLACSLLGCSALDRSDSMSEQTSASQGGSSLSGSKDTSDLSPSETLMRILDAYVQFDVETVLSHIHPNTRKNAERMAGWRDFVARSCTRENHVIEVVGVKLVELSSKDGNVIAKLLASVRTTPGFSGRQLSTDGTREYEWSLIQLDGTGPWYHYGGGF